MATQRRLVWLAMVGAVVLLALDGRALMQPAASSAPAGSVAAAGAATVN